MSKYDKISVGTMFGKIMVLDVVKHDGKIKIYGICDCGKTVFSRADCYTKMGVKSCGCTRKHGYRHYPEYYVWKAAKSRCFNKNDKMYKNYGARGISMFDEWKKDFKKFYEAIGPRPSNQYSLDRIDNDKGYEPGNVKWSTDMEQASNKTNNRKFKICCQIKHLREWSRIFGVDYKLAHARIQYGWPVEKALSPVKLRNRKINR